MCYMLPFYVIVSSLCPFFNISQLSQSCLHFVCQFVSPDIALARSLPLHVSLSLCPSPFPSMSQSCVLCSHVPLLVVLPSVSCPSLSVCPLFYCQAYMSLPRCQSECHFTSCFILTPLVSCAFCSVCFSSVMFNLFLLCSLVFSLYLLPIVYIQYIQYTECIYTMSQCSLVPRWSPCSPLLVFPRFCGFLVFFPFRLLLHSFFVK